MVQKYTRLIENQLMKDYCICIQKPQSVLSSLYIREYLNSITQT